jgi:hypothetical protein
MAQTIGGQVGPTLAGDNTYPPIRLIKDGSVAVSEVHGRYYEQTYRGNVYTNGTTTIQALTANTISLTATGTPILGVWNPLSSTVNLVILQAALGSGGNNTATVGSGAFVWASSTGNGGITTGSAPFNCKTLTAAGSQAKGMAFTALTGLTNNLVVQVAADFPLVTLITTTAVPTTVFTPTTMAVANIDGAFIVPPGGVLALLNVTSTTTVTVTGRLLWEEVPL